MIPGLDEVVLLDPAKSDELAAADAQRGARRRGNADGRRRRPGRRTAVLLAIVAILAGVLFWLVYFSPFLTVKQVAVTGSGASRAALVLRVADVPAGEQMIEIDTSAVTARVSDIQTVTDVNVTRSWPNTIVISVSERVPVAYSVEPGDAEGSENFGLIDAAGAVFQQAGKAPKGVPELQAADPAARTAALAVLAALPPEISHRIEVVTAQTPRDITFELKNGSIVRWGGDTETARKALILSALLRKVKAGWYDVSAPEVPTTANASPTPAPRPSPSDSASPSDAASASASPAASALASPAAAR